MPLVKSNASAMKIMNTMKAKLESMCSSLSGCCPAGLYAFFQSALKNPQLDTRLISLIYG